MRPWNQTVQECTLTLLLLYLAKQQLEDEGKLRREETAGEQPDD